MVYKMAVFGPSGSGKTVLCKALAEQALGPIPGRGTHAPTAGCRVQEVLRNLNGTSLSIQLWDTGGGESFHRLAPVFAVHAIGLVLVYDARKVRLKLPVGRLLRGKVLSFFLDSF
ncbi:hypothetical protein PPROV_001010100 [Pycnococcus provasolii]|uniref:Uncharacterized protein n=1 Tax=Pycnococcus provasolii TaxID=41880 RepID=A0A830HXB6_9CHLO|nr:hypothetical protein PPROV_001010100 [Pycnococcus provasolii]